ncbi:DUF1289 domain-containing protein [Shewanella xiamenensis]|uniref:DUF1289 domain-containing protein n=1 Tax=Shewanella xiamenensis TaxID=332186 RepID=UPI0004D8E76D|nr:DUF1289 domain-containing protein [Shewanella xiamenensis]KEK27434.1 hypothetical protein SXM_2974 [Shewanella xiamenensis]
MEQLAFFDIPSPCIGVCQTDARGYCKGCLRSRDERFNWLHFTDAEKHDVIRLCHQRKRRRELALYKARQQALEQERAAINPQLDFAPLTAAELDLGDLALDE